MDTNEFFVVDEINLLVYSAIQNRKSLSKVLSKYTGLNEELFDEKTLQGFLETACRDICRVYHSPTFLYTYFERRKYESEVDALKSALHMIYSITFSDYDKKRLASLKEYLED